jgi:peptidoglycan/xylan/chitin deacetylase (PgdA/CDA1 family)
MAQTHVRFRHVKSSPIKRAAAAAVLAAALLPIGPLAAGKAGTAARASVRATTPVAHVAALSPTTVPPPPPVVATPAARAVWDVPGSGFHPGDQVVALTFDDGPNPLWTDPIMEILARYNAPATFFIVGRMANGQPDRVRDEVARGFSVGNHTWDHANLVATTDWAHEVDDTTVRLKLLSGRGVTCARPPFGLIDASVNTRLRQRGMTPVLWDIDSRDYTRPGADAIVRNVLSALRPGAIILMHDGGGDRSQTVAALPRIIEGIRAAGMQPVGLCRPAPATQTSKWGVRRNRT